MSNDVIEIRDAQEARRHVVQGIWLSRAASPCPELVGLGLELAREIASEGAPLPPVGFVADLGYLAQGAYRTVGLPPATGIPGWDPGLARRYEDYVLGRLFGDRGFERAADAVLRYRDRDRIRSLAFLARRICERAEAGGVMLAPAVLKTLQQAPREEVLAEGWASLEENGLSPRLAAACERLVAGMRGLEGVLAPEDLLELESGTAVAEFHQRLALRQIVQATAELGAGLPKQRPARRGGVESLTTRVPEEDRYPIGGYSSLSTRGGIESLVPSQLLYLEAGERPDLFDAKYARDELLYYSRDENVHLRRREAYVFGIYPELAATWVKDRGLPWQRGVLVLALLVTAVRKLQAWLDDEGLVFEFLLLHKEENRLQDETRLLATLFHAEIGNGSVVTEDLRPGDFPARCESWCRRARCHAVAIGRADGPLKVQALTRLRLAVDRPAPRLQIGDEEVFVSEGKGVAGWSEVLGRMLATWVG